MAGSKLKSSSTTISHRSKISSANSLSELPLLNDHIIETIQAYLIPKTTKVPDSSGKGECKLEEKYRHCMARDEENQFVSSLFIAHTRRVTSTAKEKRISNASVEIITELEATSGNRIQNVELLYIIDVNDQLWLVNSLNVTFTNSETTLLSDADTSSICFGSTQYPNAHMIEEKKISRIESLPNISTLNQRIPLEDRAMKKRFLFSPQAKGQSVKHKLKEE